MFVCLIFRLNREGRALNLVFFVKWMFGSPSNWLYYSVAGYSNLTIKVLHFLFYLVCDPHKFNICFLFLFPTVYSLFPDK